MLSLIDRDKLRPLRIAIDAGNGMAGITVPRVFRDLPIEVTPMYFEPDGTFPNHPANPIEPENIAELREVVVENGYDLGAAFDGDADRVFLVDEKGDVVGGDILTSMVASRMLEREPRCGDRLQPHLIPRSAGDHRRQGRSTDPVSRRPLLHQGDDAARGCRFRR